MFDPDSDTVAARSVLLTGDDGPLSASIAALLGGAERARLAVGYLFVEGLAPLADVLDTIEHTQLLIGNVVNRLTDEQLRESGALPPVTRTDDEFAATYREARNRAATETALNLHQTISRLERSAQNRDLLVILAHWIAAGRLSVRLSTQHRLHAKVAIASYPDGHRHAPGRAIVGTTNFSMPESARAGSVASNIDVILRGTHDYERLTRWFEGHWQEAQDFQRDLFNVLGRAWPLTDPL